jgi:Domain of unknown function (DUF4357)
MEFYRRIGIVDRVRALGYPADNPMDVFLTTRLSDPPIAVLKYPSVAERRKQIAESPNGSFLLEPYQLVSQNTLVQDGDHLKFTRDAEFSSPSAAATVVHGGSANGLLAWKNSAGKTLKELEAV